MVMMNLVGWNLLFISRGESNAGARSSSDKSHVFQRRVPNNKPRISREYAERAGSPHFKRWGLGGHRREQPLACYCERPSGTNYCGSPPPVSCLSPGHSMPVSVLLLPRKKKQQKMYLRPTIRHTCAQIYIAFTTFLFFSIKIFILFSPSSVLITAF